jgi:co-chaperonin GroES (HSP10)
MVEVGDRVLVESEKVGTVTRSGVVTAVLTRVVAGRAAPYVAKSWGQLLL